MIASSPLPRGWHTVHIGHVSKLITSGSRGWAKYYADSGDAFIRMGNLNRGNISINLQDTQFICLPIGDAEGTRTRIALGDILLSITADVGRIAFIGTELPWVSYVSQHLCLIRIDSSKMYPKFVAYQLEGRHTQKHIGELTDNGAKAGLSLPAVSNITISVPPLVEQQAIADVLGTWDAALSACTSLHKALSLHLNALRESLLAGHCKGAHGFWPMVRLGEVTRHLTARNNGRLNRNSVMGVTKAEGVVPMREHVMAADLSRYLVLPPQAFAYNPMRINIGSIAMSDAEEDVLVSPDYVVFACDPAKLLPRYLNHLRKTARWARFMDIAGNGSVRIRIYYADLADFEFHLPPLDEQARVVAILDDAEREIALLHAERRAREAQRNALATKLLTGEWRVAV